MPFEYEHLDAYDLCLYATFHNLEIPFTANITGHIHKSVGNYCLSC